MDEPCSVPVFVFVAWMENVWGVYGIAIWMPAPQALAGGQAGGEPQRRMGVAYPAQRDPGR
jgi:hypothetical protein